MKKIIIGFLILVGVLGGYIPTMPKDVAEAAASEPKTNIKLSSSQVTYFPGLYGYKNIQPVSIDTADQVRDVIKGSLFCTDDGLLFVRPRSGKYDTVIEVQYKDIIDILVPAYGLGRRLVVKCKSNHYTFELTKGIIYDREGTYNFYRFIATKAGLEIKPGFETKEKVKDKEVPAEKTKSPPEKAETPQQVQPPLAEKKQLPALVTSAPSTDEKPKTSTSVAPSSSSTNIVTVTWTSVNILSGPGNNNSVMASAKQGDKLTVLGKSGEWFKVRLVDGQQGWVSNRVVK